MIIDDSLAEARVPSDDRRATVTIAKIEISRRYVIAVQLITSGHGPLVCLRVLRRFGGAWAGRGLFLTPSRVTLGADYLPQLLSALSDAQRIVSSAVAIIVPDPADVGAPDAGAPSALVPSDATAHLADS